MSAEKFQSQMIAPRSPDPYRMAMRFLHGKGFYEESAIPAIDVLKMLVEYSRVWEQAYDDIFKRSMEDYQRYVNLYATPQPFIVTKPIPPPGPAEK